MKKLTPKMVNRICWILWAVGALVAFLGTVGEPDSTVLCITGILVMLAVVCFRLVFFRCPECGTYLDRGMPEFCPHCGAKISEKDS